MAKSFAITTTATETLRPDAKGHAEAGFTVTNTTARPIRGLAKVRPLADTKQEWLKLQGEAERDFAAGATHQFTVSFDGPAIEPASAASPGSTAPPTGAPSAPVTRRYPFRLDVESALNPDEDFTEGPTVTVEMTAAPPPNGKPFPKWIIFVILGIVLLIGIIVLVVVLMSGDKEETDGDETPTPSPTESVSPSTEQPSPTESVVSQCIKFTQEKNQNLSPIQVRSLCRGISNPQEPSKCVERVVPRRAIPVPGRPRLTLPQAVSLCAGTNDADKTVSCFQAGIARKVPIAQAINACRPKQ